MGACINLDLVNYVTKEGVVSSGRVAWACLDHPAFGRLGFVGLYGPNEVEGRCALGAELIRDLDSTYRWIHLGDFNMVIKPGDQCGGDGLLLRGREAKCWVRLIRKFNLNDTFSPGNNSPNFS